MLCFGFVQLDKSNHGVGSFEKFRIFTSHYELGETCLRILILYDTSSVNRNTEKVAKAISGVLKEKRV